MQTFDLPATSMKVLVTGATGFVGREVLRQLFAGGHCVRVLVRDPIRAASALANLSISPHPHSDSLLRTDQEASRGDGTAVNPTLQYHTANVLDPTSLWGAASDCDASIHLVGIISEIGDQTFENIHLHATQNVIAETRRAGVGRWVQMSALGARANANSRYHRTKWLAEEAVRASGLDWTILRPSLIYGPEDHFVNLFATMARWSPILPVMGDGHSKLQPVDIQAVARCFVGALTERRSIGQTLDVCGPDRLNFNQVLDAILAAAGRRRMKLHLPLPFARLQAGLFEVLFPMLLRKAPPLNRDQLLMLQEDNVGDGSQADELFALNHRRFASAIRSYLN